MGGFTGGSKQKSYGSTQEYRDLFQGQINPFIQQSMANIQQAYQNRTNQLGALGANMADRAQMLAMQNMAGAVPGAVNSAGTQAYMQIAPMLMQSQSQAEQEKLAAQLGVNAQALQAYQQLAALSGGSYGRSTQGWGNSVANFMQGIGGMMSGVGKGYSYLG